MSHMRMFIYINGGVFFLSLLSLSLSLSLSSHRYFEIFYKEKSDGMGFLGM